MGLNYPTSPANGTLLSGDDGPTWSWDGIKWSSSPGWTVINRTIAAISNQASISLALPGSFRTYKFQIENLFPVTADTNLYMLVSLDGGLTYKNAVNDYSFAGLSAVGDGTNALTRIDYSLTSQGIMLNGGGAQVQYTSLPSKMTILIDPGANSVFGSALISSHFYGRNKGSMELRCAGYCRTQGRWTHILIAGVSTNVSCTQWELSGVL